MIVIVARGYGCWYSVFFIIIVCLSWSMFSWREITPGLLIFLNSLLEKKAAHTDRHTLSNTDGGGAVIQNPSQAAGNLQSSDQRATRSTSAPRSPLA